MKYISKHFKLRVEEMIPFQVAEHQAPVKSVRWVKAPNYTALMTGSWDKTLKFWDTRQPNPILSIDTGERCYCADVEYPMAVVGTAGRGIIIYNLEGTPRELKRIEPPLKYQHRCISVFKDKKNQPTGGFSNALARISLKLNIFQALLWVAWRAELPFSM